MSGILLYKEVSMKSSKCLIYTDEQLGIEAYIYQGKIEKFPAHFHNYYELGYIENGERIVVCQQHRYKISKGDIVLFNPKDSHSCTELNDTELEYCCLHIPVPILERLALEYLNLDELPYFSPQVIYDCPFIDLLTELHSMIVQGEDGLQKEELFYLLMESMISEYTNASGHTEIAPETKEIINSVCKYIEMHYSQNLSLNELCRISGFSKYYFLHAFTAVTGISPYSYLETVRINHAKELLKKGNNIVDIALQTGFSHQSHFTNFFKKFVGMTPKQYSNIFSTVKEKDEQ